MKILHRDPNDWRCYNTCEYLVGSFNHYHIGERFLIEDGEIITGPFKIIDMVNRNLVFIVDDDFCLFEWADREDAEPEDLTPLIDMDYEPVTSNIFLDGFLGASYIDDSGILRVDIDDNMQPLKEYYSGLMDQNNIDYTPVSGGFIFSDQTVIEKIFNRQRDIMPPKYTVGFLSSFVTIVRIYENHHPRYARYGYTLMLDSSLYEHLAIKNIYWRDFKSSKRMISTFGGFEPFRYCADAISDDENDEVFTETIHREDVFRETMYLLTVKIVSQTGCSPRILGVSGGVGRFSVRDRDGNEYVISVINEDYSGKLPECTHTIRYEKREPFIYEVKEGEIIRNTGGSLFIHPLFDFGPELSDFVKIILKKM